MLKQSASGSAAILTRATLRTPALDGAFVFARVVWKVSLRALHDVRTLKCLEIVKEELAGFSTRRLLLRFSALVAKVFFVGPLELTAIGTKILHALMVLLRALRSIYDFFTQFTLICFVARAFIDGSPPLVLFFSVSDKACFASTFSVTMQARQRVVSDNAVMISADVTCIFALVRSLVFVGLETEFAEITPVEDAADARDTVEVIGTVIQLCEVEVKVFSSVIFGHATKLVTHLS